MGKIVILIITDDNALVASLGGKLQEWGAAVFHFDPGNISLLPEETVDIVLIDVRRNSSEILRHFNNIRQELPHVEAILVNTNGNIKASKEGMRAKAGDELIVPFDMETLRKKVNAACIRSRKRQRKQNRRSLSKAFDEMMSAATFAQAGEFQTALDILESPSRNNLKKKIREKNNQSSVDKVSGDGEENK